MTIRTQSGHVVGMGTSRRDRRRGPRSGDAARRRQRRVSPAEALLRQFRQERERRPASARR